MIVPFLLRDLGRHQNIALLQSESFIVAQSLGALFIDEHLSQLSFVQRADLFCKVAIRIAGKIGLAQNATAWKLPQGSYSNC